jgi:hypothetical protein
MSAIPTETVKKEVPLVKKPLAKATKDPSEPPIKTRAPAAEPSKKPIDPVKKRAITLKKPSEPINSVDSPAQNTIGSIKRSVAQPPTNSAAELPKKPMDISKKLTDPPKKLIIKTIDPTVPNIIGPIKKGVNNTQESAKKPVEPEKQLPAVEETKPKPKWTRSARVKAPTVEITLDGKEKVPEKLKMVEVSNKKEGPVKQQVKEEPVKQPKEESIKQIKKEPVKQNKLENIEVVEIIVEVKTPVQESIKLPEVQTEAAPASKDKKTELAVAVEEEPDESGLRALRLEADSKMETMEAEFAEGATKLAALRARMRRLRETAKANARSDAEEDAARKKMKMKEDAEREERREEQRELTIVINEVIKC